MFRYIPYESPKTRDGKYTACQTEGDILLMRRIQLGLSQYDIARKIGIPVQSYQRLESGDRRITNCTMEIALAICATLLLDPCDLFSVDVEQPKVDTMKPLPSFDDNVANDLLIPKKAGRKPNKKGIMAVYLNDKTYPIQIPYDVLSALGKPSYIRLLINPQEKRVVIQPTNAEEKEAIDVPDNLYDSIMLAIRCPDFSAFLRNTLGWSEGRYMTETRIAYDNEGNINAIVNLTAAVRSDPAKELFVVPACFDSENGTAFLCEE